MKHKVIPRPLKKGTLGGKGFFSKSSSARHAQEMKDVSKYGYAKARGKLTAIEVFNKNRNPKLSAEAKRDGDWLHAYYRGKKK